MIASINYLHVTVTVVTTCCFDRHRSQWHLHFLAGRMGEAMQQISLQEKHGGKAIGSCRRTLFLKGVESLCPAAGKADPRLRILGTNFRMGGVQCASTEFVKIYPTCPLMYSKTRLYDAGYVSSGTSSSLPFVPFQGRKKIMVRRPLVLADDSPGIKSLRCTPAAFFNESIIRDTITGRYLKRSLVI